MKGRSKQQCFASLTITFLLAACGNNTPSAPTSNTVAPVISFTASTSVSTANSEFTLSWSASDADSCTASGDWNGSKSSSGNEQIAAAESGSKIYSLSCSGTGGETSASVEVVITSPATELNEQWDYTGIVYGADDPNRQWLNIHMPYDQSKPAPIYLFAHSNGSTANDMSEKQLDTIAQSGYAAVSWESFENIGTPEQVTIGAADAQLAFDWIRANAAAYNLDPNHIVIGGRSRGSIVSWRLAHSNHPSIQGIYMYNALPEPAWENIDTWDPVNDVTVNSPMTYLVYGPDFDDDDNHNPVYVDPVIVKYQELGIDDNIVRYVDMWGDFKDEKHNWTNDGEIMHYFAEFVASLDPSEPQDLVVDRTTEQIALVESRVLNFNNDSFELNFYRNQAYSCGLSGNYTFMVMEPANNPGAQAPLWIYLHGGGYGWFEEDGYYQAVKNLTKHTWNHEETFDDFIDLHLVANTHSVDGTIVRSTLTRRIQEGYRIVFGSLCDHDLYSGRGAPYLNNPNGGQVNGLQANMAAVDYTVNHFPTSHVFAHGTSAGSIGVFNMAQAYLEEGVALTGIIADSWTFVPPRVFDMFDALVGQEPYVFNGGDLRNDGMAKIGFDYEGLGIYPEAKINNGLTEVPSMFIIGELDPACGGGNSTIAQAQAAGLSNCAWMYDDLRKAIDNQINSPHLFDLSPTGDHVETNRNNPVNDRVDNFLNTVLATTPPHPFVPETAQGFNTMLMGHSFFRPIAEQLPFHASNAGILGHTQVVEFSGGETGAPMALWQDEEHRSNIQAVLDTGNIELFGMTYEGSYPTTEGYQLWFDYALSKNPNTKFFIGLPWPDFPADYADADSYANVWDYEGEWLPFIDSLRALYPDVDIFSIPYGQAAFELRTLFETGDLPDITALTGPEETSLFVDSKGHAGNMIKDLSELIWLNAIYGVDLESYPYDSGYQTNLKAIASSIMEEHDPAYNIQQ
ncbi:alpha/beta hydrolase [Paraferrimonas sp. SM1919]|uniref:alpha/beta hydrolase n=1 Tax=Paraferrimonas sp. SM1919 TaxID=2662263 RepID=UPI0013D63064|nr:hypothetical protein [Paraferrimonas sp. SM1919]